MHYKCITRKHISSGIQMYYTKTYQLSVNPSSDPIHFQSTSNQFTIFWSESSVHKDPIAFHKAHAQSKHEPKTNTSSITHTSIVRTNSLKSMHSMDSGESFQNLFAPSHYASRADKPKYNKSVQETVWRQTTGTITLIPLIQLIANVTTRITGPTQCKQRIL